LIAPSAIFTTRTGNRIGLHRGASYEGQIEFSDREGESHLPGRA
jgi:hypothetical protein